MEAAHINTLLDALQAIDPARLTYTEWISIGAALHHEGQPVEVWDDWSRSDPRYKSGECSRKWRSFSGRSGGSTAGTIYYHAKQSGWKHPTGHVIGWNDWVTDDGDYQRKKLSNAEALFEAWRFATTKNLCTAIRLARNALNGKAPDTWTEAETLAVINQDRLEYWENHVNGATLEDQMEAFRKRKEVDALCQTILQTIQTKSSPG